MTQIYPEFELPRWVLNSSGTYTTSLAGSAASPLSLNQVISLSTDPETTKKNLDFSNLPLGLGSYAGDAALRQTITDLYDHDRVAVQADDVVIANATTGANLLVFQSLLQKGDHVISLYPCYGQLVQYPAFLGAEVSYWRLHPSSTSNNGGWTIDVEELKALIKPNKTKMLILNCPHNPTGTVISTAQQTAIVQIARENDLIIVCDEIFRPLFHPPNPSSPSGQHPATSFLEHSSQAYDKIVVTGSLSKPWGLSGTRIGWVVCTNNALGDIFVSMRQWTTQSCSLIDEVIAREVLSPRCRQPLLDITLTAARQNLELLASFVAERSGKVECTLPEGGGTAFMKILGADGEGVDDVAFCHRLKEEVGVLLAPGSLTFGVGGRADWKGFVRVHVTAPVKMFRDGIEGLGKYLDVAIVNGK